MLSMILMLVIAAIVAVGGGALGWWNDINTELQSVGF